MKIRALLFAVLALAVADTTLARAAWVGTIIEDQTCLVPGDDGYSPAVWGPFPEGDGFISAQGTYDGAQIQLYYMNHDMTAAYAYPGVLMTDDDAQPLYLGAGMYVCVGATDTDTAGGNATSVDVEVWPFRDRDTGGAWRERTLNALPAAE